MKRACLVWTLFAPAWGQIAAPLLGFLPDGKDVRPVYGIPAAATVADPIRTGETVGRAQSVRDVVLILDAEKGAVSILAAGVLKYVPGTGLNPDRTALSPTGQAAALWFTSTSSAQVLYGLSATPALRRVDAAFLREAPSALAVSDDGQWMAGVWQEVAYAFGPQNQVLQLPARAATALEFFPATHDLAVATADELLVVADVGGRTAPESVWQRKPEETFDAVAVAGGPGHLYAATRTGGVWIVPLRQADGEAPADPVLLDCGCAPVGLSRLAGNAFRLTGAVNGSIKLFDAGSAAILFAPVRPPETLIRSGGRSR